MPPKKAAPPEPLHETSEPEKDSKPQGTLQAMAAGLSVGHEPGLSPFDRYGPAIALFLVVALKILLATDILPNPGPVDALSDFLLAGAGFGIGGWAGKLGARPKT